MNVRAKKKYGQHFLKDQNIAVKIVNSMDLNIGRNVLEIGPGMGVLTKLLLQKDVDLKVVELDAESVHYLEENFSELANKIVHEDFLKLDLTGIFNGEIQLIGNLPYNISSQIFFRVLQFRDYIPQAVFMIQREVAERIVSPPGSKTYGILSVLLQTFYDTEILFHISPAVFYPPPKVNSAVIKLVRNGRESLPVSDRLFQMIVKHAFNQRRKTLRNALKSVIPKSLNTTDEIFSKRAEQLTNDDFLLLSERIHKKNQER
mgnify:CR=1 FL=1